MSAQHKKWHVLYVHTKNAKYPTRWYINKIKVYATLWIIRFINHTLAARCFRAHNEFEWLVQPATNIQRSEYKSSWRKQKPQREGKVCCTQPNETESEWKEEMRNGENKPNLNNWNAAAVKGSSQKEKDHFVIRVEKSVQSRSFEEDFQDSFRYSRRAFLDLVLW